MTRLIHSWILILGLAAEALSQTTDLVFIHHSCGQNWLGDGLNAALVAKDYIDERNDIYYGTDMEPDSGRPDSLADTPGDRTDMCHWILWFNDYLAHVKIHECADGTNQIIMFKSCYPNSDVYGTGTEPGDPFVDDKTLANYKSIYRHPGGPGGTYTNDGYVYRPLEDVFAANPQILFIPVTAPPLRTNETTAANAFRARLFNNWLKNEWLANYNARNPGLNNVAVFDWFNILAYSTNMATWSNRLRAAYATGDSHPNSTANITSTWYFASGQSNFIDKTRYCFLFKASNLGQYSATQLLITWPSFSNCTYTLKKSTNLAVDFYDHQTNIQAVPPQNSCTVGVENAPCVMYRVDMRP